MTYQVHPSVTRHVVQLLSEQGFEGMAQAMECLLNECMKIERQQALGVGPYQWGEARHGELLSNLVDGFGMPPVSVPEVMRVWVG
jgi:hypothetical protein